MLQMSLTHVCILLISDSKYLIPHFAIATLWLSSFKYVCPQVSEVTIITYY